MPQALAWLTPLLARGFTRARIVAIPHERERSAWFAWNYKVEKEGEDPISALFSGRVFHLLGINDPTAVREPEIGQLGDMVARVAPVVPVSPTPVPPVAPRPGVDDPDSPRFDGYWQEQARQRREKSEQRRRERVEAERAELADAKAIYAAIAAEHAGDEQRPKSEPRPKPKAPRPKPEQSTRRTAQERERVVPKGQRATREQRRILKRRKAFDARVWCNDRRNQDDIGQQEQGKGFTLHREVYRKARAGVMDDRGRGSSCLLYQMGPHRSLALARAGLLPSTARGRTYIAFVYALERAATWREDNTHQVRGVGRHFWEALLANRRNERYTSTQRDGRMSHKTFADMCASLDSPGEGRGHRLHGLDIVHSWQVPAEYATAEDLGGSRTGNRFSRYWLPPMPDAFDVGAAFAELAELLGDKLPELTARSGQPQGAAQCEPHAVEPDAPAAIDTGPPPAC